MPLSRRARQGRAAKNIVWPQYSTWAIWKWKDNMQRICSSERVSTIYVPCFCRHQSNPCFSQFRGQVKWKCSALPGFKTCRMLKLFAGTWSFCVSLSPSTCTILYYFLPYSRAYSPPSPPQPPHPFKCASGALALTDFNLKWPSDFLCFEALGVGPGGRTRPHVASLAHGLKL